MPVHLLLMGALVSLSRCLTIPIDSSAWPSRLPNGTDIHNPQVASNPSLISAPANITAPLLEVWPAVPFTFNTGRDLNLTITHLGSTTSPTSRVRILDNINAIHRDMAHEGDHYATISKAYSRTYDIVTVFYGSRPDADLKRYQAIQIISLVYFLMLDYEPREILVSEITLKDESLGTFALRFQDASP